MPETTNVLGTRSVPLLRCRERMIIWILVASRMFYTTHESTGRGRNSPSVVNSVQAVGILVAGGNKQVEWQYLVQYRLGISGWISYRHCITGDVLLEENNKRFLPIYVRYE